METLEGMSSNDHSKNHSPIISLHALLGTRGPQTMHIQGFIKNHKVIILVDTGSTHNFIDQLIVKRIGCQTHLVVGVNVIVANGDKMWIQKCCKGIAWGAQGLFQCTDFLVLTLMGCDIVLGVQ